MGVYNELVHLLVPVLVHKPVQAGSTYYDAHTRQPHPLFQLHQPQLGVAKWIHDRFSNSYFTLMCCMLVMKI